jgi:DNA replication protein DnaC
MRLPANKLEQIKQNIINECDCEKKRCHKCASKISRYTQYAESGIPLVYWDKAMKDFQGDKRFKEDVTDIISDIDKFYSEGKSIALVGNLGTGKSYAGCAILRKALVSGYTGIYIQMVEIINGVLSKQDSNLLNELATIDFLMIDEFDPRHVFNSEKVERIFGSTLEYLLRTRFQNKLPTILCSNAADIDDVLSSDFAKAFSSLKSMYLTELYVSGKDFRKIGVK